MFVLGEDNLMKMLTVFIPEEYCEALDMLVIDERFPNRSEAIRSAIRDLVQNELKLKEIMEKRRSSLKKKNFDNSNK
jgi:Arc/MetJ-type ribon-helix-helix transcriptional regulator